MFQLKPLSKQAIPRALEKAEHYRVLNEPDEAESICLDILDTDPANQHALVVLLLALTDQFDAREAAVQQAKDVVPRLSGEYEQAYYAGIIAERHAKARLGRSGPDATFAAYEWLQEAMNWYEKAEGIRPSGNDDAILRWNTCARFLMQNPAVQPRPRERQEESLLE